MAIISTFELLVKPQLPQKTISAIPPDIAKQLIPLTRTIIQGYFLTISNVTSDFLDLSLVFTVKTPSADPKKVLAILDTSGQNIVGTVFQKPGEDVSKTRFNIPLAGNDTALFILQPNIVDPKILKDANFELRGYAEISLSSVSTPKSAQILVTPEHRGTFFGDLNGKGSDSKLGEVSYALPLASGKALFDLIREA